MIESFNNEYLQLAKALTYCAVSFIVAMWWTPTLVKLLNWLKFWKKQVRPMATTGEALVYTKKFYEENELKRLVPRGGGIVVWVTSLAIAFLFWIILKIEPNSSVTQFLNFIDQRETFIPLGTLFFGSILGLVDDTLSTMDHGGNDKTGGLRLTQRIWSIAVFSLLIGLWFHFKINIHSFSIFGFHFDLQSINLPFNINGGWLIILVTFIILVGTWSASVIDGFDGLAAGVFIPVYLCFAGLSFIRGYYDIATLLMVIVGSMIAYLWFNLPPAKVTFGETGTAGILLTLGVVAIWINAIDILPIAFMAGVLTSGSDVIQIFSKKVFKKKVFLAAPLHHHFESKGMPRNQITFRYWIFSWIFSILGFACGYWFR